MKVLLTGGTGFVGSHVLKQMLEAGHSVRALRRAGSSPRIDVAGVPEWVEAGLDQVEPSMFDGVDVLVHLAAHSTNPPYDDLANCLYWNVTASTRMVEMAHRCGINRFVVAGSCFEYGASALRYPLLTPEAPLEPNNPYAISKAAASVALTGLSRQLGLQMQLLRVFHVYGEGEPAFRFWSSLRRAAQAGEDFPMSPGEQVRDFIQVEVAAAQIVRALNFDGVEAGLPRTGHVATGQPMTLLDFAGHWWKTWQARSALLPGRLEYRPDDVMRFASTPECCLWAHKGDD